MPYFRGTIGKRTPGAGPRDAAVVLWAEAPGADEEEAGAPLVGPSGQFLFEAKERGRRQVPVHVWPGLEELGLGRDVVRCENVLEVRPLNNDLDSVSLASMQLAQADSWRRLEALAESGMKLLVPMGNCALNTALRSPLKRQKKKVGGYTWKWPQSISAWRGSVNPIEIAGHQVIMIPTFHPAFFLYGNGGSDFQAWRGDWLRVAEAAEEGIEVWPKLRHIVAPTWREIETFERLVQHSWHREREKAILAFDIETVGAIIDCVGFCVDGETTLTLPLLPQLWTGGKRDVARAWGVFQRLMEHEIPKGTHWGYYDVYRVERQKGWRVRKWWWDSYNLHHLLDPADTHRLSYCASRDLQLPYWKHMGKEDKRGLPAPLKKDWRLRHTYCGIDVGATWWLIRGYVERLASGWEAVWAQV